MHVSIIASTETIDKQRLISVIAEIIVQKTKDIDKSYISPYDKFLCDFDKKHSKSTSQQKEIEKHRRIAALRDNPAVAEKQGQLWDAF